MSRLVHWSDVFRGFSQRHAGMDPQRMTAQGWLEFAADASRKGLDDLAADYLEAGLLAEAYDRDCCTPPLEYQELYGRV